MATARESFLAAVSAHREALGWLAAIRRRLDGLEAETGHAGEAMRRQQHLADRMAGLAAGIAPGWLGAPWPQVERDRPPVHSGAESGGVAYLRVGVAYPAPKMRFPALVPLLGVGHLAVSADAREPAVAGLLRSLLTRCLAALPVGCLRILAVDGVALGAPFMPFRALVPAGLMSEPVTHVEGLRVALDEAEEQVRRVQSGAEPSPDVLLLAVAALPSGTGRGELARLSALAHAGPAARVHLLVAGYPPPTATPRDDAPRLELTSRLAFATRNADGVPWFRLGDPPLSSFGAQGRGLNAAVALDPAPPEGLMTELCRRLAGQVESDAVLEFDDLVPAELWTESSVSGLRTVVGRLGRADAVLALDDATPHWLVGGRTGSGKTVFLLDVLYGLAARYSPDELALYLLDFKEGVSFTEFVPTEVDPTWVPHARTVGVESDREYGLAVLAELVREMNRRAGAMKQAGVTNLAQLRAVRSGSALPRILAVIDEFHVLFQGNDETAKRAAEHLEDVARRGRSFGIHLVLASQSMSGIETFYTRSQSVFGQFGMRIALSGGGGVLDVLNEAAAGLPIGTAVVNDAGGVKAGNRRVRFPDADTHSLALLRHRLWNQRGALSEPPQVFLGYAEQHVDDDSTVAAFLPSARRRRAVVGRAVDIGLSTASFTLDPAPGRNLAVVGTSPVGADVLQAIVLGLSRQHRPGTATFFLVGLVDEADEIADGLVHRLHGEGHVAELLDVAGYRSCLVELAAADPAPAGHATYVVVFGADIAATALKVKPPGADMTGIDALRTVLRDGPGLGVHVFGWWRGMRRLSDDLGLNHKDDVAGLVALNVRGSELGSFLGQVNLKWSPRLNRALFVDRQADSRTLIVPYVTNGRYDTLDGES